MIDIPSLVYDPKYEGDLELFLQEHPLNLTEDDINGYAVVASLQLEGEAMSYGKAEYYLTEVLTQELTKHWKENYDPGPEIHYGVGLIKNQAIQLYNEVKKGGIRKALSDLNKARELHDDFKLFHLVELTEKEQEDLVNCSKMGTNKENDD